jgi:hypothetical protein
MTLQVVIFGFGAMLLLIGILGGGWNYESSRFHRSAGLPVFSPPYLVSSSS